MFTTTWPKAFAVAAVMGLGAQTADAAVLGTFTNTYGGGSGITISDGHPGTSQGTVVFTDSFDFSSLVYASIDSFDLELTFSGAGNGPPSENWSVRVFGGSGGGDLIQALTGNASPFSFNISAFAAALQNQIFSFGLSESTNGADSFALLSSSLTVNGTPATVPLPASGLLLLGALGAGVVLRRRKQLA
jgi:hypothetical protein